MAVGDSWDLQTSCGASSIASVKRLLQNVTELSLFHIRREIIIVKFSSLQPTGITNFPGLKTLRLVGNDFMSLKNVSNNYVNLYYNMHESKTGLRPGSGKKGANDL